MEEGGVKPEWHAENCIYCGKCVKSCPVDAWQGENGFIISFGGLYSRKIAVGKNFLLKVQMRTNVSEIHLVSNMKGTKF